jgi:hypothetical protein
VAISLLLHIGIEDKSRHRSSMIAYLLPAP